MKTWVKPEMVEYRVADLLKSIKARALSSVAEAMSLGALYDQGNRNYNGNVKLPDSGVVAVNAKVLGYICVYGYLVYEVIWGSNRYKYKREPNGEWVRVYF